MGGLIVEDLPHDLRLEVSGFLVHSVVRFNPLLASAPKGVVEQLVSILKKVSYNSGDILAERDEPGDAMFMLAEGIGHYKVGHQWTQPSPDRPSERKTEITIGDSFGEEIILGFEDMYRYTIVASTPIEAYLIPESGFVETFSTMPDIVEQMRKNYKAASGQPMNHQQGQLVRPVLQNVENGIPTGFSDTVLDKLRMIGDRLDGLETKLDGPNHPLKGIRRTQA